MSISPKTAAPATSLDARALAKSLARYGEPSNARGAVEIAITFLPLVALWATLCIALKLGYWLALPLAIPAAGFLLRLFMIQHDCGHGSFFRHQLANDWTGRLIGVLTLTPYSLWKRTHALHHAGSGCLEHRGFGDVNTLTVAEYRACSFWGRLGYRLYRHPVVMFGFGPAYLFLLQHRLPVGLMNRGWAPWTSVMGTNLAIALLTGAIVWFLGVKILLLVHLPILLMAATAGVWLFFVQHQFEHTVWEDETQWDRHDAALHGSSYYDLPGFLQWFTANIGVHHVHHLCSRIPFYRLPRVLAEHPELRDVERLTFLKSLGCVRLALWCQARRKLVRFGDELAAA